MISQSFKGERQTKTRSALLALFLFWGSIFILSGCTDRSSTNSSGLKATRLSGATMGTTYNVTLVTGTEETVDSELIQQAIDALLLDINQTMSTYVPDSELMRLNSGASQQWVPVSADLFNVLSMSRDVSVLSSGAFDVTVGPLVDLWGFGSGASQPERVPSDESLVLVAEQFGQSFIDYDETQSRVRLSIELSVDLSAIAKGYGVDRVSELVSELGFGNHLVEIGGELRLAGLSQRATPWRIAIESPLAGLSQRAQRAITLSNQAMATSGDYRNYFEVAGQRYSHTIDPRTLKPITHNLASVTVLAPRAAQADALATAFNVLGVTEALKLANQEAIAAFFLVKTESGFDEISSEAFKPYLEQQ